MSWFFGTNKTSSQAYIFAGFHAFMEKKGFEWWITAMPSLGFVPISFISFHFFHFSQPSKHVHVHCPSTCQKFPRISNFPNFLMLAVMASGVKSNSSLFFTLGNILFVKLGRHICLCLRMPRRDFG